MADREVQLRLFLMQISDRLSQDNRAMLGFLLRGEVPSRDIDTIVHDSRASMSDVWNALIDREKITPDNPEYLVRLLQNIQRLDLVRKVNQYYSTVQPASLESNTSNLFKRS